MPLPAALTTLTLRQSSQHGSLTLEQTFAALKECRLDVPPLKYRVALDGHERATLRDMISRGCLDRRIPDRQTLTAQVQAWETRRNRAACKIDWQFTIDAARINLKPLYPKYSAASPPDTLL